MIEPSLTLRLPPSAPSAVPAPGGWRPGLLLEAVAVGRDRAGTAPLRIGAETYSARVPFPVRSGDRLVLEVVRGGTTPLLRALHAPRGHDPVHTALRTALPGQLSQPRLLAALASLTAARGHAGLPTAAVRDAAERLFRQLLHVRELRGPGRLRQAMADAGTLLEARLRAGARTGAAPDLGADLKAGLLRLQQALGHAPPAQAGPSSPPPSGTGATTALPVPPLLPPLSHNRPYPQPQAPAPAPALVPQVLATLRRDVDGVLARLQLHQLASVGTELDGRQVWLLELPIRRDGGADVVHLRIERDPRRRRASGGSGWSVELAFDLDGLGPVHGRIELRHGAVATRLWAERDATAALLQRELPTLRTALEAAGVPLATLDCRPGAPPQAPRVEATGLVDERA